MNVSLLGPEVAIRTFEADLKGAFKGKPLPARVFNTEILVTGDGKWVEWFYQVTMRAFSTGALRFDCNLEEGNGWAACNPREIGGFVE
ncbi:MAG: hypothetical protein ABWZ01_02025 [Methyloceanibacter sp.]